MAIEVVLQGWVGVVVAVGGGDCVDSLNTDLAHGFDSQSGIGNDHNVVVVVVVVVGSYYYCYCNCG